MSDFTETIIGVADIGVADIEVRRSYFSILIEIVLWILIGIAVGKVLVADVIVFNDQPSVEQEDE